VARKRRATADHKERFLIMTRTYSRRAAITLMTSLLLVAANGTAWAHHSWAAYEAGKRATLTGTIRELNSGNPHATLVLETTEKTWDVMLDSPTRLQNRGVTADLLATGRTLTIEGLPRK
jgi:hypothetical protein